VATNKITLEAVLDASKVQAGTQRAVSQLKLIESETAKTSRLSAGHWSKYGTAVATISGQVNMLGIKNTAVARTFGLLGDAIYGALGPGGVAVVAIGGLITLIGSLVQQQRELEQATKDATKALIEQAAKTGISNDTTAWLLGASQAELQKRRGEITDRLGVLTEQRTTGITTNKVGWQWDTDMKRLRLEASQLVVELYAVNAQLDLLSQSRYAGRTLKEVVVKGGKWGAGAKTGLSPWQTTGEGYNFFTPPGIAGPPQWTGNLMGGVRGGTGNAWQDYWSKEGEANPVTKSFKDANAEIKAMMTSTLSAAMIAGVRGGAKEFGKVIADGILQALSQRAAASIVDFLFGAAKTFVPALNILPIP